MPPRHHGPGSGGSNATTLFNITGWQGSKAQNDPDGGAGALLTFLRNKTKAVIHHSQQQGDTIIITVNSADSRNFSRLNQYRFAGVTITVQEQHGGAAQGGLRNQTQPPALPVGPRNQHSSSRSAGDHSRQPLPAPTNGGRGQQANQRNDRDNSMAGSPFNVTSPFGRSSRPPRNVGSDEQKIFHTLEAVIRERFNVAEKFLNLAALAQHPTIISSGLTTQPAEKVFQALFICCEDLVWKTKEERVQQVESLSLANNALTTVKDCIWASDTFHSIKNLDLSNNQIVDVGEVRYWSRRFRSLEHLIMAGNPCDADPATKTKMVRWYPNLKLYNGTSVTETRQAPPPSASPAPFPPAQHPEFDASSTFGVATADKSAEQLLKEQMGLKLSVETRLKMEWVEKVLIATNFNYTEALALVERESANGNVPTDALLM